MFQSFIARLSCSGSRGCLGKNLITPACSVATAQLGTRAPGLEALPSFFCASSLSDQRLIGAQPQTWHRHRGLVTTPPARQQAEVAVPAGAVVQFRLAQLGEGIKECELLEWHVSVGDRVEEFQRLCEVQSDKATVEVTSRYAGTIRTLHADPGAMVQVGEALVDIEVDGDTELHDDAVRVEAELPPTASAAAADAGAPHAPSATAQALATASEAPTAAPSSPRQRPQATSTAAEPSAANVAGGSVLASPAVRRLAKEQGINLASVAGTGPEGRITKDDLASHVEAGAGSHPQPDVVATGEAPAALMAAPAPPFSSTGRTHEPLSIPIRGYRRAMVRSMTAANEVPHFHYCDEVDVGALIALRRQLQDDPALAGVKLTFLPFIMKAISLALREHPALNSSLSRDGSQLLQHPAHNLGVAMDTPSGLVVPNVKDVARLSVGGIAAQLAGLQGLAAQGRLPEADVTGGTLTVSNVGSIGGTYATPLVNVPEAAIVALGRVRQLPRFGPSGAVEAAAIMSVSWGADHRIVDGATLARFGNLFKLYVEQPQRLLLHLA